MSAISKPVVVEYFNSHLCYFGQRIIIQSRFGNQFILDYDTHKPIAKMLPAR